MLSGANNVNPTGILQIDTTAPTVSTITAPSGDDGPGTLVAFTVQFSETVTVNTFVGTPTPTPNIDTLSLHDALPISNALVFNYTVGATGSSQDSADLKTATSTA